MDLKTDWCFAIQISYLLLNEIWFPVLAAQKSWKCFWDLSMSNPIGNKCLKLKNFLQNGMNILSQDSEWTNKYTGF